MATPFEVNMKEIDLLKRIERLKKELVGKEEMIRERENVIRERENVIREREDELKEKDRMLDEKEEELSFWQKSVKTTREKGDKIADEFKFMFERREEDLKEKLAIREREFDEQLQTLEDQKEKMRLLEEKERSEREELAPHSVYHNTISEKVEDRKGSKIQNSPTPPKLSTYDGKTEWKPYYIQFNHIAKKYMWNEREKLDKMIECLREKALKFFSSRPENVQKDFKLLCQKFKERFERKDQSHIIRRQLQEIQQKADETLEEFAERIEDLSTEAYPDSPEFFRSTITIDAFLRGCLEKRAALVTLDKDPKTLDKRFNI
ncbi:chromosome partition protein Smc-like [Crassostrea angulata]|uniref:chromosome partition protein Smc-like n=1 Tax=Magallana angulata TaxID=2784310 RepID=UPI0022B0829B|nr:chromosome partition protein Smc-like [Crassostrea angulata]